MATTKYTSENCLNPNKELPIDTACLNIFNEKSIPVTVYSIFSDCFMCDGQQLGNLLSNSNKTFQVSSKYPLRMYYKDDKNTTYCQGTYSFRQHGQYGWNFTANGCSSIYTILEPSNPYLPLLAALMFYLLVFVVLFTSKMIIKTLKLFITNQPANLPDDLSRLQESESTPQLLTVSKTGMRMQALDAFRGLAVLLMIFVNNGGGKYVFLNHSAWNGITVADFVLPWFAFAMGFSIVNSIRVQLRVSVSRTRLIVRQIRRTIILILFGLMINSHRFTKNQPLPFFKLRFPGVLQLLAISYFICSVIETCFTNAQRNFQFGRFIFLQDILERWAQWIIFFSIIIIHSCITFFLPVPGCPKGYLGPGGYDHHGDYTNCTGGAAGYIDRLVFGSHCYQKKMNAVYGTTLPHDPEGILNTLSTTVTVFLGIQAGRIFVTYYQAEGRVIRWLIWFIITGLLAGILCGFSKEGGIIPINKNMMTLSFDLLTSSSAFLLLAILYFTIDYKKWWNGAPFIYAGANAILLYVGHEITMGLFPLSWGMQGTPTHATELFMNLWTTTVWAFIAYGLYKKEILITV